MNLIFFNKNMNIVHPYQKLKKQYFDRDGQYSRAPLNQTGRTQKQQQIITWIELFLTQNNKSSLEQSLVQTFITQNNNKITAHKITQRTTKYSFGPF